MFKKITLALVVSVLLGSILSASSIDLQAKDNTPLNLNLSQPIQINLPKKEDFKNKKITKLKPPEFKIVNGEIDTQLNVKMSKSEEENFGKCKSEEKQQRRPKYKNAPTACLKKPTLVSDHISDQDYNLLWQAVNQQVEETAGVDLKVELCQAPILCNTKFSSSSRVKLVFGCGGFVGCKV